MSKKVENENVGYATYWEVMRYLKRKAEEDGVEKAMELATELMRLCDDMLHMIGYNECVLKGKVNDPETTREIDKYYHEREACEDFLKIVEVARREARERFSKTTEVAQQ